MSESIPQGYVLWALFYAAVQYVTAAHGLFFRYLSSALLRVAYGQGFIGDVWD